MHFDLTYIKNHRRVYVLASKIVQDAEVAKDITQEVFIKLLNSLEQGRVILNPEGWLTRTTCNTCLNNLRDSRKSQHDNYSNVIETEQSIDSVIVQSEESLKLIKALAKLKDREQLIITLYSEGLSYTEISRISGVRYSSVGSTISRLLKKLKTLYINGNE